MHVGVFWFVSVLFAVVLLLFIGAAVSQLAIHLFFRLFSIYTDSGNPARRWIFELSTSTVLLILLQSTQRLSTLSLFEA